MAAWARRTFAPTASETCSSASSACNGMAHIWRSAIKPITESTSRQSISSRSPAPAAPCTPRFRWRIAAPSCNSRSRARRSSRPTHAGTTRSSTPILTGERPRRPSAASLIRSARPSASREARGRRRAARSTIRKTRLSNELGSISEHGLRCAGFDGRLLPRRDGQHRRLSLPVGERRLAERRPMAYSRFSEENL